MSHGLMVLGAFVVVIARLSASPAPAPVPVAQPDPASAYLHSKSWNIHTYIYFPLSGLIVCEFQTTIIYRVYVVLFSKTSCWVSTCKILICHSHLHTSLWHISVVTLMPTPKKSQVRVLVWLRLKLIC